MEYRSVNIADLHSQVFTTSHPRMNGFELLVKKCETIFFMMVIRHKNFLRCLIKIAFFLIHLMMKMKRRHKI